MFLFIFWLKGNVKNQKFWCSIFYKIEPVSSQCKRICSFTASFLSNGISFIGLQVQALLFLDILETFQTNFTKGSLVFMVIVIASSLACKLYVAIIKWYIYNCLRKLCGFSILYTNVLPVQSLWTNIRVIIIWLHFSSTPTPFFWYVVIKYICLFPYKMFTLLTSWQSMRQLIKDIGKLF